MNKKMSIEEFETKWNGTDMNTIDFETELEFIY